MNWIIIGTWVTIGILGPGALFVFIWFLRDLRRLWARTADHDE